MPDAGREEERERIGRLRGNGSATGAPKSSAQAAGLAENLDFEV